jgi:hypothetical protein
LSFAEEVEDEIRENGVFRRRRVGNRRFHGFLAVTMAWQFAFLVIGSDPARFRLMMIPSAAETLGYVMSMGVLYIEGRIAVTDVMTVAPDLLLGVLFTIAFAKTSCDTAGVAIRRSHS